MNVKAWMIQSSSVKWHQWQRGCQLGHLWTPHTSTGSKNPSNWFCIMTSTISFEQPIKHRKAQEGTTPKESLTQLTVVIHQNDFVQEVAGGAVQDAVHRAEQGGQRLVVETNHNAGRGQISRVGLLSASANRNRVFGTIYRGVSTGLGHCRNFLRTSKH